MEGYSNNPVTASFVSNALTRFVTYDDFKNGDFDYYNGTGTQFELYNEEVVNQNGFMYFNEFIYLYLDTWSNNQYDGKLVNTSVPFINFVDLRH